MTAARWDHKIEEWLIEMPDNFCRRVLDQLRIDDNGCYVWTGGTVKHGYGRLALPNRLTGGVYRSVLVHRAVWISERGPVPEGLVLDHDDPSVGCKNRACANVSHLVAVTQRQNQRGAADTRLLATHCSRGHRYKTREDGTHYCPQCKATTGAALYRRRKEYDKD